MNASPLRKRLAMGAGFSLLLHGAAFAAYWFGGGGAELPPSGASPQGVWVALVAPATSPAEADSAMPSPPAAVSAANAGVPSPAASGPAQMPSPPGESPPLASAAPEPPLPRPMLKPERMSEASSLGTAETADITTAAVLAADSPKAAPAPGAAANLDPGEGFSGPQFTIGSADNPAPSYPETARRRGFEGRTVLRVSVAANGRPQAVEIARSSGHGILDRAAFDAVSEWRFEPARIAGQAIAATVEVPVVFRLE